MFSTLPEDLQIEICLYLGFFDIFHLQKVDKAWHKAASAPQIFHDLDPPENREIIKKFVEKYFYLLRSQPNCLQDYETICGHPYGASFSTVVVCSCFVGRIQPWIDPRKIISLFCVHFLPKYNQIYFPRLKYVTILMYDLECLTWATLIAIRNPITTKIFPPRLRLLCFTEESPWNLRLSPISKYQYDLPDSLELLSFCLTFPENANLVLHTKGNPVIYSADTTIKANLPMIRDKWLSFSDYRYDLGKIKIVVHPVKKFLCYL